MFQSHSDIPRENSGAGCGVRLAISGARPDNTLCLVPGVALGFSGDWICRSCSFNLIGGLVIVVRVVATSPVSRLDPALIVPKVTAG